MTEVRTRDDADEIGLYLGRERVGKLYVFPSVAALNQFLETTPHSPFRSDVVGSVGYLPKIEVPPELRGEGRGTRLVHQMILAAKRRGLSAVMLHAGEPWGHSHARQEEFWWRQGFRKLRYDDGQYHSPPMQLLLDAAEQAPNEDLTWREVYGRAYHEAEARGLEPWRARDEASRAAWRDYEARTGQPAMIRNESLHRRIAAALGWSESGTQSMSLAALRDAVRHVDAALAAEISERIQSGRHITRPGGAQRSQATLWRQMFGREPPMRPNAMSVEEADRILSDVNEKVNQAYYNPANRSFKRDIDRAWERSSGMDLFRLGVITESEARRMEAALDVFDEAHRQAYIGEEPADEYGPNGSMPAGFESFDASDVFGEQQEPSAGVVSTAAFQDVKRGDVLRVGSQRYEVLQVWDSFNAMVQKPGARRKAFALRQDRRPDGGEVVEVREQRGTPESTLAGPVLATVPIEAVERIRATRPNGSGYYVWPLARGSNEPLAAEGPWGPYDTLESAKTFARIGATEGAYDRAVSLGLDPNAPGFCIVRRYEAGSGDRIL